MRKLVARVRKHLSSDFPIIKYKITRNYRLSNVKCYPVPDALNPCEGKIKDEIGSFSI